MTKKSVKPKQQVKKSSGSNRVLYMVLAAVAVVAVGALLVAGGESEAGSSSTPFSVAELSAEADPAAGVVTGPADAPVTLIEFADFQCPHCRNFNSLTGRLLRLNYAGPDGPVRWIAYDFPLNFQNSFQSALAARCAEAQGRFWAMHDLLFARQDEWGLDDSPRDKFADYAADVGLDVDEFEACYKERRHLSDVVASRKYGEQLGVTGTPTLFLNGERVQASSYQAIEELIQTALAAAAAQSEERSE